MAFKEFVALNLVLPLAEKVMGTCASNWYKRIGEMNQWPREEILNWQQRNLVDFVTHAYEHTVYYRDLFDRLGLKPRDIQSADDLKKLPPLTKSDIRSHFNELIADDSHLYKHRSCKTGGSTGEPMPYICDESVWGYITGTRIYSWKTTPYHYGDKFVALGSSSLFNKKPSLVRRVYDGIRNEVALNSMGMTDEVMQQYLDKIIRERIRFVYGYASSVYLLARYAYSHSIDMSFVEGVYTTSENLTPVYREMIEKAFKCRVMDCYGSRDAGVVAYEINPGIMNVGYNSLLEVVNQFEDGSGTLLSTNVLNYSFPLLRYDFGDLARLGTDESYNGQVITKVFGRTSDVLCFDNGHVLTSPGFTIMMRDFDVAAYDIQKTSGRSVKIVIQPVKDKYDKKQEEKIFKEMHRFVGDDCEVDIEYVDHFEPLKNGKRRYFMNDVSM